MMWHVLMMMLNDYKDIFLVFGKMICSLSKSHHKQEQHQHGKEVSHSVGSQSANVICKLHKKSKWYKDLDNRKLRDFCIFSTTALIARWRCMDNGYMKSKISLEKHNSFSSNPKRERKSHNQHCTVVYGVANNCDKSIWKTDGWMMLKTQVVCKDTLA